MSASKRPTVHTNPALRERVARFLGREPGLFELVVEAAEGDEDRVILHADTPGGRALASTLAAGERVHIDADARELIGSLVARIEELEALGRTPRFVTDEDERRVFEVIVKCSRCEKWFAYDKNIDVRSERGERVTVCPCGTKKTLALGGKAS